MEILELLPFLGLLLLQFIYQIYKAYKKKNPSSTSNMEGGNDAESYYTSPLNSMEKEKESSKNYYEDQPVSGELHNISPNTSSFKNQPESTFSILNELFGEQSPKSVDDVDGSTPKPRSARPREFFSSEDQLEKEYNEVEVASRFTRKVDKNQRSYSTPLQETVFQKTTTATNAKTTPALELLKKMRSRQNLKDYWRVKFILDQPVGMEITPLGRTNQIPFKPSQKEGAKF